MSSVKRFRTYIETWLAGKTVRGIAVTLYDIDCCISVYNDIATGKKPEFLNEKVKRILDKCNITTIKCGVGWKVA